MSVQDFPVDSQVETNQGFKDMSGLYFKGTVRSCDEHYVDILTDRALFLSIRTSHVQEAA